MIINMKKSFIFSVFLVSVCLAAWASRVEAAASVVYTTKTSLSDVACTGNNCVAVGNNLIAQSVNKGKTWKVVLSKNIAPHIDGSNLEDVDCVGNLCIGVGQGATIVRSSDSGKTWKVVGNTLVALNKDSFASYISGVDCVDKDVCYAVGGNFHNGGDINKFSQAFGSVILKTTNGGLTWNVDKIEKAVFNYPFPDLTSTSNPNMFEKKYVATDEVPLHLMDKILCKNRMECFGIGGQRSIFHTTDGWKTVTLQEFKVDNPVKLLTNGPNDFSSFVYFVDGQISNTPQKVARYGFSDIGFTGDGGVIVEAMDNGVHIALKSMDNGQTWKNINIPLSISAGDAGGKLACYKSVCVLTVQNLFAKKVNILTSLDNGNTWKATIFKKTVSVSGAACADANSCFVVGDTIPKGVVIKVK